jgi:hypothetical protein
VFFPFDHAILYNGQLRVAGPSVDAMFALRADPPEHPPVLLPIQSMAEIVRGAAPGTLIAIDFAPPPPATKKTKKTNPKPTGSLTVTYTVRGIGAATARQLRWNDPVEFPLDPRTNQNFTRAQLLDEAEIRSIMQAVAYSSSDDSRYFLNCAYLHQVEPGTWRMVGTDGRRLYCSAQHRLLWLKPPVVYPASDDEPRGPGGPIDADPSGWMLGASSFLSEPELMRAPLSLRFAASNRFAELASGALTVILRVIDGKFPNYQQVIPRDVAQFDGVWLLTPEQAKQARGAIEALPKCDKSPGVSIENSGAAVFATALDANKQPQSIPMPGSWAGAHKQLTLGRDLLLGLLAANPCQIRLRGEGFPALGYDPFGGVHVVMGMRDKRIDRAPAVPETAAAAA